MLAERLFSLINSNEIFLKSVPATSISYSTKMQSVFQKVRRRLSLQCNVTENNFRNIHKVQANELSQNEKSHSNFTERRTVSLEKSESFVKSEVQEKNLSKRKLSAECCEQLTGIKENKLKDMLKIQNPHESFDSHHGNSYEEHQNNKRTKTFDEKDEMFEVFQPWALKTYGDQAKTKTITLKKKARILKALIGQEHSNPDSSKFRFWVKSKGFTTKTPDCFLLQKMIDDSDTNLFVASVSKDFGERTYRKVAVVEKFFEIIYNVHVELGGRNGRHAGQKRTYRIITETYGFLPREAVTKFLSICPECQKNLRPCSPLRIDEIQQQTSESFSELDIINCSSHTESSIDSAQLGWVESVQNNAKPNLDNLKLRPSSEPSTSLINTTINEIQSDTTEKPESVSQNVEEYYQNYILPIRTQALSNNNAEYSQESLFNCYQLFQKFAQLPQLTQLSQFSQFSQLSHSSQLSQQPVLSFESSINLNKSRKASSSVLNSNKSEDTLIKNIGLEKQNSLKSVEPLPKPQKDPKIPNTLNKHFTEPTQTHISKFTYNRTQAQQQLSAINLTFSSVPSSRIDDHPPVEHKKCEMKIIREPAIDLEKVKPITSTYLKLTRSMGLTDEDALKIDDLESMPTPSDNVPDPSPEDPYAGLMKDADKLKLMLLAWNYQNSNAVRNGTDGPDLGVVGGLWAQYQNALAMTTTKSEPTSGSPIPRAEQSSPMETQDETNSSGQKDDDEGSDDESDDKIDANSHDPERLKAFNMFVRLFVDENLDRMIPISKQPKEKIQAIIDSCSRQFPEFSERSRKRIRTYLKSCRRNKKTREGWDNTSRPTPAHLTSVQAEQILAIACENESMNAKRMRVGLDPISQSIPLASTSTNIAVDTIAPSTTYPTFRTTPSLTTSEAEPIIPTTTAAHSSTFSRTSPLALNATLSSDVKLLTAATVTNNSNNPTNSQNTNPLFRPTDYTTPSSTSPFSSRSSSNYPPYFSPSINGAPNATPTDLSMKPNASLSNQSFTSSSTINTSPLAPPALITHKLSANEITAARQVITAYRESAAFLLRTADQVEQLLIQQQ